VAPLKTKRTISEPGIISNLFPAIPENIPEELFDILVESDFIRIERIVSQGHTTGSDEWLDQSWDEWVILLSGEASILFEGDETPRSLKPGDYILIPANCRHKVTWTDPSVNTVWLAVHFNK